MHLSKFVKNKTGKILMSILLGLGLATLFKQVCKGKNCVTLMAPNDIDTNSYYKYDGKCYKPEVDKVTCNKNLDVYEMR
tara:strand:- start:255 stop:491 length:237 start_codon:yes stop_codon:yes gene_type:complete